MTRVHRFRTMGCDAAVGLDDRPAGDADRVRFLFEADDRRFTRFANDSELLRVNDARGPVLVSPRFARAVRAALWAFRSTDGMVDPTLLRALEAAGYDRDFRAIHPNARPGFGGMPGRGAEVRLSGQLLTLPPGVALDLNGVVKAMAVDDALGAIDGRGWVSAGGDLATGRPLEVDLPGGGSVLLERGALATSGRSVRRWFRAGEEQHHLIDPRTGRPSRSPWEQVTVCGASCLMADVAAKAAFLMGDAGPGWLDARGMPGRFVRTDGSIELNGAWHSAMEPVCI